MRLGKRFILGFLPTLFILVGMLVAGCGSTSTNGSTTKAPAAQQIYRDALPVSTIATLDPALDQDLYSNEAIAALFTGLVSLNDKLEVQPQLAQALPTVSADGLTYTFTLKPNLHFSDGTPLTAQDVAYSIDRALSPAETSLNGVTLTYLGLIKDATNRSTKKVASLIGDSLIVNNSNNTLEIIISKRTAYFLEALAYPTSYVVEQKLVQQWGDTHWPDHLSDNNGWGSSGPFKVQSYTPNKNIVLIPNSDYYGTKPVLQHLEYDFINDINTMYSSYFSNQVDNTIVPANDETQAESKTSEYHKFSVLGIGYIGINFLYKPFDNIDIRQALSLAINRDAITKNVLKNQDTPSCHIVPNGMPGYDANLQCPGGAPTSGDTAKAQQLFAQGLAAEGLTKATFPAISFVYPSGSQARQDMVTTIISMWQQVLGISITGHAEDFNQLLSDLNNTVCNSTTDLTKCQNKGLAMWTLAWGADYPDPQDFTTLQFDKGSPNNYWNYGQNLSSVASAQQSVQTELENADGDLGADRLSLYNDAEQKLVNDVAWLSLFQQNSVHLVKPYVYGLVDNAQQLVPPDDWGNIYITTH